MSETHSRFRRFSALKLALTTIVGFVPEGDYDPPTGHLRSPGTIGVSEPAFAAVLEGAARSLKAGGFTTICFHRRSCRQPQAAGRSRGAAVAGMGGAARPRH
jgi:hypothetical protein